MDINQQILLEKEKLKEKADKLKQIRLLKNQNNNDVDDNDVKIKMVDESNKNMEVEHISTKMNEINMNCNNLVEEIKNMDCEKTESNNDKGDDNYDNEDDEFITNLNNRIKESADQENILNNFDNQEFMKKNRIVNNKGIKITNNNIKSNAANESDANKNFMLYLLHFFNTYIIEKFLKILYILTHLLKNFTFSDYHKLDENLLKLEKFTFVSIPWNLYIPSMMFFALFSTLFYISYLSKFSLITFILTLFAFLMTFVILLYSKIKISIIDTIKQKFYFKQFTFFCSEESLSFDFKNISYILMVKKGNKKGSYDDTKYYIRFVLTNSNYPDFEFSETIKYDWIKYKYLICLALIKRMFYKDVPKYLLKNETIYEDYIYK